MRARVLGTVGVVEVTMWSARRTRAASVVLAFALAFAFTAAFAATLTMAAAAPAPAPMWTLLHTLDRSGSVHSPSFITPARGWAVVGNRLLQTSDGGARWSVFLPAEWTMHLPTSLSFADPTYAWAVGDGFVMASRDGGAHWSSQASALAPGVDWVGVQGLDGAHAFAVGANGGVLGTGDGGATWTVRAGVAGGSLAALRFTDATHGWAVGVDAAGRGVVLATADGGATWIAQPNPAQAELSALAFTDAAHGWAAGAGGLIRTVDGGATWTALPSPLDHTPGSRRATLAFPTVTHGFLGIEGRDDGGPCMWETTDGGVTWSPSTPTAETAGVYDLVALDAGHVLAAGLSWPASSALSSGRIWESAAGGTSATPAAAVSAAKRAAVTAKLRARPERRRIKARKLRRGSARRAPRR